MARAPNASSRTPRSRPHSGQQLIAARTARAGRDRNYGSGGSGSTPHSLRRCSRRWRALTPHRTFHTKERHRDRRLDRRPSADRLSRHPGGAAAREVRQAEGARRDGRQRSPELPGIPTVDESAWPGYEVSPGMGCSPPPARLRAVVTPPELGNREGRAQRGDQGKARPPKAPRPAGSSPEEYAAVIRADAATWGARHHASRLCAHRKTARFKPRRVSFLPKIRPGAPGPGPPLLSRLDLFDNAYQRLN